MTTDAADTPRDAPQPEYTDQDRAMAVAVVTQDLDEPVQHIITLSDEELIAVEGVQHRQLTPLPWADENLATDVTRAAATASATRSLIARGLVTMEAVTDPRRPGQSPEDQVAPAVKGTVVARRTSDWVVIAERTTTQGVAMGMFYIFDAGQDRRAILEVYDQMGMHLFFVLEGKDLAEQFWLWVDPAREIGEDDGEVEEYTGAEFTASERYRQLREGRAATAVQVRGRSSEAAPTFTLFAQPGRLDLLETEGEGEEATMRIGALSRAGLDELLTSLITEPAEAD